MGIYKPLTVSFVNDPKETHMNKSNSNAVGVVLDNADAEPELSTQSKKSHWVSIIEIIKTPLGFFVFAMLLVETFLTGVFTFANDDDRTLAIVGMLTIAGAVIMIVAGFAYFKPESLVLSQSTTIDQPNSDTLSAKQSQILGFLEKQSRSHEEILQRDIEKNMGFSHASAELFYRLETLTLQGFIQKRRVPEEGQFAYRLKVHTKLD